MGLEVQKNLTAKAQRQDAASTPLSLTATRGTFLPGHPERSRRGLVGQKKSNRKEVTKVRRIRFFAIRPQRLCVASIRSPRAGELHSPASQRLRGKLFSFLV